MKSSRWCCAVILLASLAAIGALAPADDAAAVRKTVNGFAEAWNRHDMRAFGSLFAPDADFVNVAGAPMKGREDIQSHHAYSHGAIPADTPGFGPESKKHYGIFKNSTMRFDQVEVRFLRPDVALAHVSWQLSGDARSAVPRRGVFLFVLTRENGTWLFASAQNTEIDRTVH